MTRQYRCFNCGETDPDAFGRHSFYHCKRCHREAVHSKRTAETRTRVTVYVSMRLDNGYPKPTVFEIADALRITPETARGHWEAIYKVIRAS